MNYTFRYKLIYLAIIVITVLNITGINSQNSNQRTSTASGSSFVVSGHVTDKADNKPVEYANVILYSVKDSTPSGFTATDNSGNFSITCKNEGEYFVSVSFIGYTKKNTEPFRLSSDRRNVTLPEIIMEEDQLMLSEVVVTGRRHNVVYQLDKQVIEAASFLSAAGGTAVDILSQTPSVRVDAEGEVSFRGSSGFKVYIDGRPSTLEGTAALEQIPVGQIENIEVLTTPSARNDADGAAGIININTKKSNIEGWSGMINVMGSTELSRNLDFLFALRKKHFRWQLTGEASRRFVLSDYDQLKTITTQDVITVDHSVGDRERHTAFYYLQSSFDWFKENTTWSAAVMGGYQDRWRGGELRYDDTYETIATGEKTSASFKGKDYVNLYEYHFRGDLGMVHNFSDRKGHKFSASAYALYETDAMEYFHTDLWDLQGNQAQGTRAWEYEYRLEAQANADYVHPFANETGKFETGYQLFTYTEDGDYNIDMFDPDINSFVHRSDLYNEYLFRRDIHALYLMLSDTYSNFSYQVGLRGEYNYWKLGNNFEWARHTRHRFDLFPSAHFSYALNDKSSLRASYTRRITQPLLFYMEPYIVYVDFYTAQRGNPFIKPEYTNSMEIGYNLNYSNTNSISAAVFHRARRDKIERIRIPYHTSVTIDSVANAGNDYSTGAELSTVLQMRKFWNIDANSSFYHYRIKNDFKNDKSWNWQLALNNNFDITDKTRMRLEAYYVSPMVSTQGRVDGFFYANATVRQQLFNRKLIASLVVRDIFSTAKYIQTRSGTGLESLSKIYPRSPLFTLTLTYMFNNFKSQKKESISHDMFEGTNR